MCIRLLEYTFVIFIVFQIDKKLHIKATQNLLSV